MLSSSFTCNLPTRYPKNIYHKLLLLMYIPVDVAAAAYSPSCQIFIRGFYGART